MKRLSAILLAVLILIGAAYIELKVQRSAEASHSYSFEYSDVDEYSGEPYCVLAGGVPNFSEDLKKSGPFESYSELDDLDRCGPALAMLSRELMPTEPRGSISEVRPSGWHTIRYDDLIEDRYLYNRCHLIAFELTGQNANELNLITGTRYMNVEGMEPFENMIASYIRRTGGRVLYRVTPVFIEGELVARGVQMEAISIDDNGKSIQFNVFVYNVQPGIGIDYETGDSFPKIDAQNRQ